MFISKFNIQVSLFILNLSKHYYMKKFKLFSVLAVIAVASVGLHSCSKIAQALQYDIPLQTGSVTIVIPPTPADSGYASGTASNTINIDSVIKANTSNTLGVSNVTSLKLTSATMLIQNPDSADNFQNFSSCTASFYTNSNTTPYQVTIANNPNVYESTLNLPIDSTVELKSYINGNQFTYSAGGNLRTSTTKSLTCTISFTFDIHVQG